MMKIISKRLGAEVTGFDDQYFVWGYGNQWTAYPEGTDGTIKQTKDGKNFEGSFFDKISDLVSPTKSKQPKGVTTVDLPLSY